MSFDNALCAKEQPDANPEEQEEKRAPLRWPWVEHARDDSAAVKSAHAASVPASSLEPIEVGGLLVNQLLNRGQGVVHLHSVGRIRAVRASSTFGRPQPGAATQCEAAEDCERNSFHAAFD